MVSVELCFDSSLGACEMQMCPSFERRAEAFARSDFSQSVVFEGNKKFSVHLIPIQLFWYFVADGNTKGEKAEGPESLLPSTGNPIRGLIRVILRDFHARGFCSLCVCIHTIYEQILFFFCYYFVLFNIIQFIVTQTLAMLRSWLRFPEKARTVKKCKCVS